MRRTGSDPVWRTGRWRTAFGLERLCAPSSLSLLKRQERDGAQPAEDLLGQGTTLGRSGVAKLLEAPGHPEQRQACLHLMAVLLPALDGTLVSVGGLLDLVRGFQERGGGRQERQVVALR